jgi:hypothetical protein
VNEQAAGGRGWFVQCGGCGGHGWVRNAAIVRDKTCDACRDFGTTSDEDFPKPQPEGVSKDAEVLLAYIADALGWTEHGGGVCGAWLSESGRTALANLTAQEKA